MVIGRVVTWDDILANKSAWNTLVWFATLVALADGPRQGRLREVVRRDDRRADGRREPTVAMLGLVAVFFFTHYLFARITAHVTAMLPVVLAVGLGIPDMDMRTLALLLSLTLASWHPDAVCDRTSPVYYGSGYIPAKDYWRLGAIFGVIFFAALLLLGVPGWHDRLISA